jgi:50S ribosomal protein L16 3-hydroxylase
MSQPLVRTGGLRCFYVDETVAQGVCYVDGERYAFGPACKSAVLALCDQDEPSYAKLKSGWQHADYARQLTEWVNGGFWYFRD